MFQGLICHYSRIKTLFKYQHIIYFETRGHALGDRCIRKLESFIQNRFNSIRCQKLIRYLKYLNLTCLYICIVIKTITNIKFYHHKPYTN